jgi:hypothetical protein
MKKIATITFHHAHNFGSMLQTYALQEFVKSLCNINNESVDYKVIDFYTQKQEELYSVFKRPNNVKNMIKNLIALRYCRSLKAKHHKFEHFLTDFISLTKRYTDETQLQRDVPSADYYISGSDQLWNVRATDFSVVNYLSFVRAGKKVSFAASFGPLKIDWSKYDRDKYVNLLSGYTCISTREQGSADNVELLTGKCPEIHLDPTFLLTADNWRKIQSKANYKDGKYILLYCLEPSKQQIAFAIDISQKLNLPIVVLRYNNKNDWFNPFVKLYDAGPCDFLSYIDNAALVLSSSFHGTAFSIIYHKPFYVLNGTNDNRIRPIMEAGNFMNRIIETPSDIEKVNLDSPSFDSVDTYLNANRKNSSSYLCKALELN